MSGLNVKIIIPTYNAGTKFQKVIDMLLKQKGICKQDILIVDSSSTDETQELVKQAGIELMIISKSEFGHGKTRKMAVEHVGCADIIVFMTQDALPYDENAISSICLFFNNDTKIAAVYGRQIPYPDTDIFGTHARLFNRLNAIDKDLEVSIRKFNGKFQSLMANQEEAFQKEKEELFESIQGQHNLIINEISLFRSKILNDLHDVESAVYREQLARYFYDERRKLKGDVYNGYVN